MKRTRLLLVAPVVVVLGATLGWVLRPAGVRSIPPGEQVEFTQVGRNGPVFTVNVPAADAANDEYLLRVAEQLSAEDIKAGASGQVSVMFWPDTVPAPKQPPTNELDASMKTQIAGLFINPKLEIKHLIRFRDGETIAERDFGRQITQ